MTLRPDAGQTKARPDLPPYDLGVTCMVEGCEEVREMGGGHHVWRRSLGPSYRDSWWVELADGTLVPNRLGLCPEHHKAVTGGVGGHRAQVGVEGDRLVWRVLFNGAHLTTARIVFDVDPFTFLHPEERREQTIVEQLEGQELLQQSLDGDEVPHDYVVGGHEKFETPVTVIHDHAELEPGTKCPTCKRRINHKRKNTSPVSKVFAFRFPVEGAAEYEETMEAVAEHWGLDTKKKYWKGELFLELMVEALQRPKKAIRDERAGRGG